MPPWTRLSDAPCIFTRPLGLTELAFYWDTAFSGTSDSLQQLTVEIPAHASHILSPENVKRAWLMLKDRQPLLCASVHEREHMSGASFVVDESKLTTLGPGEIEFVSLESDAEACALADKIMNQEPRALSNERPAQVWVLYLPQDNANSSVHHQIFFHLAHYISDGMAQNTIIKTFLDILVHTEKQDLYEPKDTLERRLGLALAMDDLYPTRKYSLARQKWRLAIAHVIYSMHQAAEKGGHTLPRTVALHMPAVSRTLRISLSKDLSRRVIASCRRAQITFGAALPVLCQLAHTRILHRLHDQGLISKVEWAHRVIQPMHMGGPLNLRPHLDQGWLASGGADQVCVAISFFLHTLPSLPSSNFNRKMETPPFEHLLSRSQFFHRCLETKRQTNAFMSHPLFMESTLVTRAARIATAKATALNWRIQSQVGAPLSDEQDAERAMPLTDAFVLSNACSSFGNLDNMLPSKYPTKRPIDGLPVPSLCLTSIRHYLRCRPTELYMSSISFRGELHLLVFCDVRTYDESMVQEWLAEAGKATEWYLGAEQEEPEKASPAAKL